MKEIKIVKALLLSLIAGMNDADRVNFFTAIGQIVNDCLVSLRNSLQDTKPAPVVNNSRATKTIATITEKPVESYHPVDGRLAMLEGTTVEQSKPITVATITKKSNGETKRQDPPKEVRADGFGIKKNHFFPGMAKNANGLVSYLYYINEKKHSAKDFALKILPLVRHELKPDYYTYCWEHGSFSLPKKAIREGNVKEWRRVLGGSTFTVKVNPNSLA